MVLQETYELVDAIYYNTNVYSSNANFDITLPNGDFQVELDINPHTRSHSSGYVFIGVSTSNGIRVGQLRETGWAGIQLVDSNHNERNEFATRTSLDTWQHITFKKQGTNYIATNGTDTITKPISNYNITLSKFFHIEQDPNGELKNVLIKAL